jgi:hypothetical protein
MALTSLSERWRLISSIASLIIESPNTKTSGAIAEIGFSGDIIGID